MKLEYSLVERNIEREYMPAARACGMGITPWSPLAAGFLAGTHTREATGATGPGRLSGPNPFGDTKFTDQNQRVLDTFWTVATELDRPLAPVAMAWVSAQPGITSPIIGASKREQLHDNITALDIRFPSQQLGVLDKASALTSSFPDEIFSSDVNWR